MTFDWSQLITWRHLLNVIDILVVWFFIYKLISLLKGTKAVQLLKGMAVIVVIKMVSFFLKLETIDWIMDLIISWGVLATIIVFQPEIRRGLEHLGRGSLFGRTKRQVNPGEQLIKALDKSVQYMAKRRR